MLEKLNPSRLRPITSFVPSSLISSRSSVSLRPPRADRETVALTDRDVVGAGNLDAGEAGERKGLGDDRPDARRRSRFAAACLALVALLPVARGRTVTAGHKRQRQNRHRPVTHRKSPLCIIIVTHRGLAVQRPTSAAAASATSVRRQPTAGPQARATAQYASCRSTRSAMPRWSPPPRRRRSRSPSRPAPERSAPRP